MKKTVSVFLCVIILFGLTVTGLAADAVSITQSVADYIYNTVDNPQVGSVGGEWAIIGLSRSDAEIPSEYYSKYYDNVEKYVKNCDGVLHNKKYTEYSRVIIALTAIGKNPADVAGYNLLTPLGDFEKTVWQGISGAVWAIIALDSGNYEISENLKEAYINYILDSQNEAGGWGLSYGETDPDVTAMVLQALAKYRNDKRIKAATDKALECVSGLQNENGGFSSGGDETSESCMQMIVALCELGIPFNDNRFVKNGKTLLDNLMTFYIEGKGFKHTYADTDSNLMATEQGLYSLAAIKRFTEGKNSLYSMSDAIEISETGALSGKNPDVKKMDIVFDGKTFSDITNHENRTEIEALASRNIINGKTAETFDPYSTMTRAEFAAIIVRGLGLSVKNSGVFSDVTEKDWFFDYVNTAYGYGIVNGISETEFNPCGTISREEAAVMIARAAKLCGMDTDIDASYAVDILAGFLDYVKSSSWAVTSLAFCYSEKILSDDVMEIKPKEAVNRGEIAEMLYNMLNSAKLL